MIPEDVAAVPDEAPTPTVVASSPGDVAQGALRRPLNNASRPNVAAPNAAFANTFNNAPRPHVAAPNAALDNARVTSNRWFNTDLVGAYRDRVVKGMRIASRSVRDMIRQGTIPQLPLLKVDGEAMCLVWHTKGMCNPGYCPRRCDHVRYTRSEYAQLHQWCRDHYPTE